MTGHVRLAPRARAGRALAGTVASAMAAATLAAAVTASAADGAPAAAGDATQRLAALYYDFEVASYCGLVDGQVGRGFERAAATAAAASGLGGEALDSLRGRAWQAAHAEWQNRGLGGFRGWCREEGLRAARRFAGPDWRR